MLDVSQMNKDALAAYALNAFGVELKLKEPLEALREQVNKLQSANPLTTANDAIDKTAVSDLENGVQFFKDDGGRVFRVTARNKHLFADRQLTACDEHGQPV